MYPSSRYDWLLLVVEHNTVLSSEFQNLGFLVHNPDPVAGPWGEVLTLVDKAAALEKNRGDL